MEIIWSRACYILTTQRSAMSPKMFEAIMFLKYNKELWDLTTVQDAVRTITKEEAEARGKDVEESEEVYGDEEFYY